MDAFVARLGGASLPDTPRVLLYGSRARGDAREDSDVDIAVVFPGEPPDAYPTNLLFALSDIAYDVFLESGGNAYLSPRPIFEAQLTNPSGQARPAFYRNVVADGLEWGMGHGR